MPICSGFIKVHTVWPGIFSQQGGLLLAPSKDLLKMMMGIYPLVYVLRLANFCSNQLFSFLSIEKTDRSLGQDGANDGHGTWFGL